MLFRSYHLQKITNFGLHCAGLKMLFPNGGVLVKDYQKETIRVWHSFDGLNYTNE